MTDPTRLPAVPDPEPADPAVPDPVEPVTDYTDDGVPTFSYVRDRIEDAPPPRPPPKSSRAATCTPRRPRTRSPNASAERPSGSPRSAGRWRAERPVAPPARSPHPVRRVRRPSPGCGDTFSSRCDGRSCPQPHQRVVLAVHRALLERDERVVGDLDVLRAHLGAALGDVAEPQPVLLLGLDGAVAVRVERVHVQLGHPHQVAGPGERLLVLLVVADHVAGVLAQVALDALAELLAPLDVDLRHPVLARRYPSGGVKLGISRALV